MVRIGIIGCGGNSRGHLYRLLNIEDAEIVAFSDIDISRAEAFSKIACREKKNCRSYRDYRKMIDNEDLDAVVISTPHVFHYEQAKYSLENDLHVLIEKPLACSSRQCEEIVNLAEKNKKVLLVSYQRHYIPKFVFAYKLIRSGKIGDVKQINIWLMQAWRKNTMGKWRQDPSISCGGMFMDSGSHIVDLLLWFMDSKPLEVYSYVDNYDLSVDVYTSFIAKFENNAFADVTINGNAVRYDEYESIFGTEGAIFLTFSGVSYIDSNGDRISPFKLPPASSPDENFINVILGKEENRCPGIYGLNVLRFTEAVYESAQSGRPVKI